MPVKPQGRQRQKGPPPGETGQEILYLRFLSEKQVPVTVKLRDGEAVYGWIEYFDDRMIRLTREGKPNLFIYKHQIRTISESFRNIEGRRRERKRSGEAQSSPVQGVGLPALGAPQADGSAPLIGGSLSGAKLDKASGHHANRERGGNEHPGGS